MKTKITSKYDSSFTAAGLLHHEFIVLEPIINEEGTKELLIDEEMNNQYLGVKTFGARKRILQEVLRRYNAVPTGFWQKFYSFDRNHQKLALFYVCLKTYPLMFDLHWDLTLKKYRLDKSLNKFQVKMMLDEIASRDEYVGSWSSSTMDKLNSRYRKILKEVGMLKDYELTVPVNSDDTFWEYFKNANEAWFLEACFYTI